MTTTSPAGKQLQWPRSPSVPSADCNDEEYLSEDEHMGGSQGTSDELTRYDHRCKDKLAMMHQQTGQSRRLPCLPKVLGFNVDGQGADWKEMRTEMMAKERTMAPKVFSADYTERRSILVEWMSQTGESVLNLVPLTIHIAVAYLDTAITKLADQYVAPNRLQLMATACIYAAAKMEENDGQVPSTYDLNRCCQDGYTPQLIVKMESLLLDLLDWNLLVLTPRHFLDLYDGGGALVVQPFEEFINNTTIPTHRLPLVQRCQREYAEFFVDVCLHDHNFVHYKPSVVAAAAVASARRMLKMTPIWPYRLAKLTQFDFGHVSQCADHLWRVYEQNFAPTP